MADNNKGSLSSSFFGGGGGGGGGRGGRFDLLLSSAFIARGVTHTRACDKEKATRT